MMIEAAAESSELKAIVSEGASSRSVRDEIANPGGTWQEVIGNGVATASTAIFSNNLPPATLKSLVPKIAPGSVFFVYGERGQPAERPANQAFYAGGRSAEGHLGSPRVGAHRRDRCPTGRVRAARRRLLRRSLAEGEVNIVVRRAVLLGVPFLYAILGLLHPGANPEIGDATGFFIGLHVVQLVLIGGLAYVLWLLVDGFESRAATTARALILPFVIVYTALDAVLGIAWGIVAQKANELPVADQAAAGRLVDSLLEPEPLGYVLYFGAGLLWLAVALAVVAVRWNTADRRALALIAGGAAVFALGHARPMGPIGMALMLIGIAWLESRPVARRRRSLLPSGSIDRPSTDH